ncbi:hypothetical protein C7B80_17890 [Cyanosarcina cf. burmensis CCALA 770]|nr:hypothetical protein C7B80_17890 [Cyanosarcina cf. burmensis CCALA 770]
MNPPVQESEELNEILVTHHAPLNNQQPITNYQLPITNYQQPITNYLSSCKTLCIASNNSFVV